MTALMRALAPACDRVGWRRRPERLGTKLSDQAGPDDRAVRRRRPGGRLCARARAASSRRRSSRTSWSRTGPAPAPSSAPTRSRKSAPDGYTLLVMSNTHTTNESLIPNRPYQLMRDFVPVSPINESDVMMVVNPALGVKNLKEFIALAKSKPGQLNYASSGPGHALSHGGRAVQSHDRHRHRARAAQDLRRHAHQRARRPCADDVRRHHGAGAERAGRQADRARHQRQEALDGDAGDADHRRGRRARLRVDHLDRRDGAGEDAAGRSSTRSMPKSARSWRGPTSRRPGPSRAPFR